MWIEKIVRAKELPSSRWRERHLSHLGEMAAASLWLGGMAAASLWLGGMAAGSLWLGGMAAGSPRWRCQHSLTLRKENNSCLALVKRIACSRLTLGKTPTAASPGTWLTLVRRTASMALSFSRLELRALWMTPFRSSYWRRVASRWSSASIVICIAPAPDNLVVIYCIKQVEYNNVICIIPAPDKLVIIYPAVSFITLSSVSLLPQSTLLFSK